MDGISAVTYVHTSGVFSTIFFMSSYAMMGTEDDASVENARRRLLFAHGLSTLLGSRDTADPAVMLLRGAQPRVRSPAVPSTLRALPATWMARIGRIIMCVCLADADDRRATAALRPTQSCLIFAFCKRQRCLSTDRKRSEIWIGNSLRVQIVEEEKRSKFQVRGVSLLKPCPS